MGAKTWMLVYADGNPRDRLGAIPKLDRDATMQLAQELFPGEKFKELTPDSLLFTSPPDNELIIGSFPGVSVIAAKEFGIDYPSKLPSQYLTAAKGRSVTLHAMHSVVDWLAFAQWVDGKLTRSLSLSPDSGIIENLGSPFAFEVPFWNGEHPACDEREDDEYPLPFHPLTLGEEALNALFGYQIEGAVTSTLFDAESIPLLRFERSRSRWKFW